MKKKAMVILWPSFVVAVFGAAIMFSLMDPVDMRFIGPLEFGRKAGYTLGFLLMWGFAACSSAFTWFLMRTAEEVNRPEAGREPRAAG
jgi:hypothetical protein